MKPLINAKEFNEIIIPELSRRWEKQCYCNNANFLKLISFNFQDYKASPMALIDAELVIRSIIFNLFVPVRGWVDSGGGSDRVDRCPQCGEQFLTRYDQYSINMERTTAKPLKQLPTAQIGHYILGFHYFTSHGNEIKRIIDFEMASSTAQFMDSIILV